MNKEDILDNEFEFLSYEKFRDAEYLNRFILKTNEDKFDFLKKFNSGNKRHSFFIKNNVFYIYDEKYKYAFQLDEDFLSFKEQMQDMNVPAFYISFIFPDTKKIYDFSFIGEM